MVTLFFHRILRPYVEDGDESKYYITGNFCSQIFVGAKWR